MAGLPELPLDLDLFLSFLDKKVGGVIASPSRGTTSSSMTSKYSIKIFRYVHIRRLQRLRMAQQDAFEEAECLYNFKAVDEMLEEKFPDSLRKADAILESQNEHYSAYLAEDDNMNCWLEAQFTDDLYGAAMVCHG